MAWNRNDMGDLSGRTAVVTGANSGLGLESARALAAAGARVLLACRDEERARGALAIVAKEATGPEPEIVRLDLADLDSVVVAAADDVAAPVERLDILLNNAGVMAIPLRAGAGPRGAVRHQPPRPLRADRAAAARPARGRPAPRRDHVVVHAPHGTHAMGRPGLAPRLPEVGGVRAVEAREPAVQLRARSRRARAVGSSLVAAAAHPGYASTALQTRGPEMSGNKVMALAMRVANAAVAQPPEGGALPQLYAAVAPEVQGGDYLGPGGPFELRGSPSKVRAATRAYREADGTRLCQASEEMTGVEYRWG